MEDVLNGYLLETGIYEIPECDCTPTVIDAITSLLNSGKYLLSCRIVGNHLFGYTLTPMSLLGKNFDLSELSRCLEWVQGVFLHQSSCLFGVSEPICNIKDSTDWLKVVNLVLHKSAYATNWVDGYYPVISVQNDNIVWLEATPIMEEV